VWQSAWQWDRKLCPGKMTGYSTIYTMIINYEKWNRKFRFSSFSAYHAKNILKMNQAKDDQS
jgi:hypothetical protein